MQERGSGDGDHHEDARAVAAGAELSGIVSGDAAAIRIRIRIVRCQRPAKRQRRAAAEWNLREIFRFSHRFRREILVKFSVAHPNPGKRSAENFTKISRQISRHLWQRKTEKNFTSALLQGSCSGETSKTHANIAKRRPIFLPPLLLVGSKELVLKVPKRGQFHAAIRVSRRRCDSCAQVAPGTRTVSRRNFSLRTLSY